MSSSETALFRLIAASERMASAGTIDAIVAILRESARAVVGADGIAVAIREGESCFYAAEDAREQRLIDGGLQSAERARVLVQRLIAFARRSPWPRPRSISPNC